MKAKTIVSSGKKAPTGYSLPIIGEVELDDRIVEAIRLHGGCTAEFHRHNTAGTNYSVREIVAGIGKATNLSDVVIETTSIDLQVPDNRHDCKVEYRAIALPAPDHRCQKCFGTGVISHVGTRRVCSCLADEKFFACKGVQQYYDGRWESIDPRQAIPSWAEKPNWIEELRELRGY